jgi:predicted acyltransferase
LNKKGNKMVRYKALDALRGLTIALMILVNTPGSWLHVYSPLLHADWHGCSPTDLVFPLFMFIIGSAMYFSFKKLDFTLTLAQSVRIIKRGAIMFAIGLALNIYPFTNDIENLRILGVLQRIGIAYILAALLVLVFKQRGIVIISALVLLGYWALLLLVGGNNAYSLEGNIVRQVDLTLLSANHLWQGKGIAFDPEGLLSTLPSVVSILFGFEVTRLLSSTHNKLLSVKRLIVIGVLTIIVAQLWALVMPINKSLWTSSFVLYTSGIACVVLAFFVWLCDIAKQDRLIKPLVIYGSNPLFIYVLSGLWVGTYTLIMIGEYNLGSWLYHGLSLIFSAKLASLIYALAHVYVLWLISYALYKRKIFIKI